MTGALFDGNPADAPFGLFQTDVAPGYRHKRIVDLLEANDAQDQASMEILIADRHSLIGEQLAPLIVAEGPSLNLSGSGQKVINALSAWTFDCPTGLTGTDAKNAPLSTDPAELRESAGCAAFHLALNAINSAVLDDEGIRRERGPNVTIIRLLKGEPLAAGEVYWDNVATDGMVETKADTLSEAINAAGAFLVDELGDDETAWAWGRIHTLSLVSDLDTATGGIITQYNENGFANDGGLFTVDVANPDADLVQTTGPSVRLVCEALPTGPVCTYQLPGGQVSHPDSPNYIDHLPDFINNTSRPLPFDITAAKAGAAVTLVLKPTSG